MSHMTTQEEQFSQGAGETDRLVAGIATKLIERHVRLGTAESCTGGLLSSVLTDWTGSSVWYEGGAVVYSNSAKSRLIGVEKKLIESHGAVSGPVAESMARGVLEQLETQWALSTTGIAGPTGGSSEKPVGTIFVGIAQRQGSVLHTAHRRFHLVGDRSEIRRQTVLCALRSLWIELAELPPVTLSGEVAH
ncbi:MAG: CinA family protein [Planctomycetota bacterium]|nr:CinA family protein [Planctomycetota bacterium]